MALSAKLKFTQGSRVGQDWTALVVQEGVAVTVASADNTDVASWRIELLYDPPGSPLGAVPGVPVILAQNTSSNTPTCTFIPKAIGCYRIRLTIWDAIGYAGVSQQDIRNAGVPTDRGIIIPPPQLDPPPLKAPVPDELNFEGQVYGWAGSPLAEGQLLNQALTTLSNTQGLPGGIDTSQKLTPEPMATLEFPKSIGTIDGTQYIICCGTGLSPVAPLASGLLGVGTVGRHWEAQDLGDDYTAYRFFLHEPVSGKNFVIRNNAYPSVTVEIAEVTGLAPLTLGTSYPILDTEQGNASSTVVTTCAVGGGFLWVMIGGSRIRKIDPSDISTSTGVFGSSGVPGPGNGTLYDPGTHGLYSTAYPRLWSMSVGTGWTRFSTQDLSTPEFIAQAPSGYSSNYAGLALDSTGHLWAAARTNVDGTFRLIRFLVEPVFTDLTYIQFGTSSCTPVDVVWDPDTQQAFVYYQEAITSNYGGYEHHGFIGVYRWTGSAIALVKTIELPISWGRPSPGSSTEYPFLNVFGGRVWGTVSGDGKANDVGGSQTNSNWPTIRRYHAFSVDTASLQLEELLPQTAYSWQPDLDSSWRLRQAYFAGTYLAEVEPKCFWAVSATGMSGGQTIQINLQASPKQGDEIILRDIGASLGATKTLRVDCAAGHTFDDGTTSQTCNTAGGWFHFKFLRDIGGYEHWYTVSKSTVATDQLVKVSGTDTTAGYLADKLAYSKGLNAITLNSGGNEQRVLANYAAAMPAWVFSSTTTDADPGSGFYRLNNATPSAATVIYLSKTTSSPGTVLDQYLRGLLVGDRIVFQDTLNSIYVTYQINGAITNSTNYVKIPVTYEASSGTPTNGNAFSVNLAGTHPGFKNSATDTTSGYLSGKLTSGSGLTLATVNGSGNETCNITNHAAAVPAWLYDTSTVDGNPTSGSFRINNATHSSATFLYMSKVSTGAGMDLTTTLQNLQPGDRIQVKSISSTVAYRVFKVYKATTDATGYVKVPVTYEAGAGSFTSGDLISFGIQYEHASYNVMDDPGAGPRAMIDPNLMHGSSKYGPDWSVASVTGLTTLQNSGYWDGTHLVLMGSSGGGTTLLWYDFKTNSITNSHTVSGQPPLGLVGFEGVNSSFSSANQKVFALTQGTDPVLTEYTQTGGAGRTLTLTGFSTQAYGQMAQVGLNYIWCPTTSGLIQVTVPASGALTMATIGAGTNFVDVMPWRGKVFAISSVSGVINRYSAAGTLEATLNVGTGTLPAIGTDGAYLYLLQVPNAGGQGALSKLTFDLEVLATGGSGSISLNYANTDFDTRLVFDGANLVHSARLTNPASTCLLTYDPRTLTQTYALYRTAAGGTLNTDLAGRPLFVPAVNGQDLLVFPFIHFSTNLYYLRRFGKVELPGDIADKLVKVSATDSTSNYLSSKIVAGSNVGFTTLNPAGNEQIQVNVAAAQAATAGVLQLAGDLGGTSASPTVAKINGSSVPAGGALTTGHVLQVTGAATLGYAQIADANISSTAAITVSKINAGSANSVLWSNGTTTSWTTTPATDRQALTEVDYGSSVPAAGGWAASIDGGLEWLSKQALRTKLAPVGSFSASISSTFAAARGSFAHYQETNSTSTWTKSFDLSEVTSKLPSNYGGNRWIQTIRYVVQVSVPNTAGTVPAITYTGLLLVRRDGVQNTALVVGPTDNAGDAGAGSIGWSVTTTGTNLTLTGTPGSASVTTWGVWLDCTATYGSSTT
jgi:hypothetical protein